MSKHRIHTDEQLKELPFERRIFLLVIQSHLKTTWKARITNNRKKSNQFLFQNLKTS